jgi:transcriptional regulator with XRE-family HTH domain
MGIVLLTLKYKGYTIIAPYIRGLSRNAPAYLSNTYKMSFRENLREALDFSGMEQKELAAQTGISLKTIENYLKLGSSMPSADKAVRIAQVLGVSVEYLVTGGDGYHEKPQLQSPELHQLLKSIKRLTQRDQHIVLDTALHLSEAMHKPH